jgi:hypothetical protein
MKSDMEPKMTSDGKYLCEADNKKFDTRADYDTHCSEAHMKSGREREKEW